MTFQSLFRSIVTCAVLLSGQATASADTAVSGSDVPLGHSIYVFLQRMEGLGAISSLRATVQPFTRQQVARWLLQLHGSDWQRLSSVDRWQLDRLKREFAREIRIAGGAIKSPLWRAVDTGDSLWRFAAEPVVHMVATTKRKESHKRGGHSFDRGVSVFGNLTPAISVSVLAVLRADVGRTGDFGNLDGPTTAFSGWRVNKDSNRVEYETVEAQIGFRTSWLSGAIGVGRNRWGPSPFANVFLDDKAAPYPYFKLQSQLGSWMTMSYIHAQLNSDLADSAAFRARPDPGPDGFVDRTRWFAAHRFSMTLARGVDLSLQESVIYGDRQPDWFYLMPVMFFWAAQHQGDNTDNYQLGFDLDLHRWPGIRLYGSWYLDEWVVAETFGKNHHNWFAYQAGFTLYDLYFMVEGLDITLEYTRLNPQVYTHRQPINERSSGAIVLGHWLGRNSDIWTGRVRYQPLRSITTELTLRRSRKAGEPAALFLYQNPSHPFLDPLDGPIVKTVDIDFEAVFEVWPNIEVVSGVWFRGRDTGSASESNFGLFGGLRANLWR